MSASLAQVRAVARFRAALRAIRDVAIPPHLIPIIKEHPETFAVPGQDGLLLPAVNGRPRWPSTITGYFKKAPEIAGRSDLRRRDI